MASRNLLHRSKLEDFKDWLSRASHISLLEPKGTYEVLRWSDPFQKGPMPIIFDGKSSEHLSCNNEAAAYVRRYLEELRNAN